MLIFRDFTKSQNNTESIKRHILVAKYKKFYNDKVNTYEKSMEKHIQDR